MDKQKVIRAALLGYGTVGSGVYALESRLKDETMPLRRRNPGHP